MTAKIVPERAGLSPVHTRDVYYLYDLRGLQTKARFDHLDGEGVTTYYDGFGRPSSTLLQMAGFERWLSYLHDRDGHLVRLTHPDNVSFGYSYDPLGRMNLVHDHGAATSLDDYIIRYWYAEAGPRYASVRGAGGGRGSTKAGPGAAAAWRGSLQPVGGAAGMALEFESAEAGELSIRLDLEGLGALLRALEAALAAARRPAGAGGPAPIAVAVGGDSPAAFRKVGLRFIRPTRA